MSLISSVSSAYKAATKKLQQVGASLGATLSGSKQPAAAAMAFPVSPGTSLTAGQKANVAADQKTLSNTLYTNQIAPTGFSPLQGGNIGAVPTTINSSTSLFGPQVSRSVSSGGSPAGAPSYGSSLLASPVSTPSSITSAGLSRSSSINLGGATAAPSYVSGQGALASATAGSGLAPTPSGQINSLGQSYVDNQGQKQTAKFDPNTGKSLNDPNQLDTTGLTSLMQQLYGNVDNVNSADLYRQAEIDAGLQQKQQVVNDYTSQLNSITANAQAAQLSVMGQGRGIPEAIIGGQQAEIAKEAAIQALPVAAQLSAAQGNLQTAQQHVDTYAKLLINDAQQKHDQQIKVIDAVMQFATKSEENRLNLLKEGRANQTAMVRDNVNFAQSLVNTAITNGNQSAAAGIMKLMANPNSPTFQQDVAAYAGQITQNPLDVAYKQAQINALNARTTATEGTTLNGKPQTSVQAQVQGYADRTNQADIVLTKLGDQFASTSFGNVVGANNPTNFFKSSDRQQYEQAQRNFVNAVLRRESGAAIAASEFDSYTKQYFPQPGDAAAVIGQKAANRQTTIDNLYQQANVQRTALPGQIIEDGNGTRYQIADDGVTLIPL